MDRYIPFTHWGLSLSPSWAALFSGLIQPAPLSSGQEVELAEY